MFTAKKNALLICGAFFIEPICFTEIPREKYTTFPLLPCETLCAPCDTFTATAPSN
jgi:hypothetical protein